MVLVPRLEWFKRVTMASVVDVVVELVWGQFSSWFPPSRVPLLHQKGWMFSPGCKDLKKKTKLNSLKGPVRIGDVTANGEEDFKILISAIFQGFKCRYIRGAKLKKKIRKGRWELFFQFMERVVEDCIWSLDHSVLKKVQGTVIMIELFLMLTYHPPPKK